MKRSKVIHKSKDFLKSSKNFRNKKKAFTYCVCIATPVLEAHDVVEDWVDCRTEVVEEAGHMEKVP